MATTKFSIQNMTTKTIECQLEPECSPFDVRTGQTVHIRGEFSAEPPTIQLSTLDSGDVFCSIFPGDGDVTVITPETR